MKTWKAKVFVKCENELGEGPSWEPSTNTLSWVDIIGKKIHTFNLLNNHHDIIEVDDLIGFAIPTTQEHQYILGLLNKIKLLNFKTNESELIHTYPFDTTFSRLNDGKCDSRGRLWAGTQTSDKENHPGSLYVTETNKKTKEAFSNIGCSNGQCWSSDDKKMYYIDTSTLSLKAYDYEIETGEFSNENTLLEYPAEKGYLDGMTIDAENKLWIAIWNGSKVIRFCPITNAIIGEIKVDAKQVTSMTFGGADLDQLFITTAKTGLNKDVIRNQVNNGNLFVCQTNIPGKLNYPFKL